MVALNDTRNLNAIVSKCESDDIHKEIPVILVNGEERHKCPVADSKDCQYFADKLVEVYKDRKGGNQETATSHETVLAYLCLKIEVSGEYKAK